MEYIEKKDPIITWGKVQNRSDLLLETIALTFKKLIAQNGVFNLSYKVGKMYVKTLLL